MRYIFLIFMYALLCINIVLAEAAVKPEELEEVVVTATRTERATEEIPAGVSAVTKEDIKNTRMFGIKEALTGLSGVQSESRNGGYDARLIIRGAGLKARYGVREIMVLLDGVPITDPDGLSRLDFVDTQLVDRIDIVKGPNSTLYGANAAGGVINIITRSPYEEVKSIKLGYGSDDTQMYNLLYGNHIGSTYFTVSGSRRSTNSWREWNEFETDQGNFKIGHMFSDKTSVEATVNYTKADIQLPGTLTAAQFETDITQLTSDTWRHSGRYSEVFFTNLKMETELGRVKLKPVVFFSKWDHYHPVTGLINEGGARVYGTDIQADMPHKIAGMDGTLTTGFTGQIDNAEGDKYTYGEYAAGAGGRISYTLSDKKGDLAEKGEDTTTKWGVFVQESISPSEKWIIDMGVRYDEVGFDIHTEKFKKYSYTTGKYVTTSETIDEIRTFSNISPRIGAVYKLTDVFNLYGNVSTGFQTPQSSELSVNTDLDPSTTYNYETGVKGRFEGGHSLDLSVFYMTVKDEIVQTTEPGNISSYSNAGESLKRGAELTGKFQALKGLFLGGAYTYSNFKFVDFTEPVKGVNYDRGGNRFPYIPKHQYTLYVSYKHANGIKAKVDTNTWGTYYIDNANTEKYEGYKFITNALVGYENSRLDVTFDVYNIFDKRYAMEVTKESGGAAKYRPAAPLSWMAKAGYKF